MGWLLSNTKCTALLFHEEVFWSGSGKMLECCIYKGAQWFCFMKGAHRFCFIS